METVRVYLQQVRGGSLVEEPNTPAENEAAEEIERLFGKFEVDVDGDICYDIPVELLQEFERVAWPFEVRRV